MAMLTTTYADIKAESDAARLDYERARSRYDESTRALLEARCNELVAVAQSDQPGHHTRLLCLLQRDHEGPHSHPAT